MELLYMHVADSGWLTCAPKSLPTTVLLVSSLAILFVIMSPLAVVY